MCMRKKGITATSLDQTRQTDAKRNDSQRDILPRLGIEPAPVAALNHRLACIEASVL